MSRDSPIGPTDFCCNRYDRQGNQARFTPAKEKRGKDKRAKKRNRSRKLRFPQVREGQAQIFGVCPQSEISQFAAEKLSQPWGVVISILRGFVLTPDLLQLLA